MKRQHRLPVMFSKRERLALQVLAQEQGLSCSAVVRSLVLQEANRRGVLPVVNRRREREGSEQ